MWSNRVSLYEEFCCCFGAASRYGPGAFTFSTGLVLCLFGATLYPWMPGWPIAAMLAILPILGALRLYYSLFCWERCAANRTSCLSRADWTFVANGLPKGNISY